jgi:hypothetical protein
MTTEIQLKPLDEQEHECFKRLERVIEDGIETFYDVGTALRKIRDEKLYREDFITFQEYCEKRWNLKRQRAYEYIDAAKVADTIEPVHLNGEIIRLEKEAHAAALGEFPIELRQSIFNLAVRASEGDVSAREIKSAGIILTETIQSGAIDDGTGVQRPLTELLTAATVEDTYERHMRQKEALKQHYAKPQNVRCCFNCNHWRPTKAAGIEYATGKCTSPKIGFGIISDSPAEDGAMIVKPSDGPTPILLTGMKFFCAQFERKPDA